MKGFEKISLGGEWAGTGISPEGENITFRGIVPGCVHTDLMRENYLPDVLTGENAKSARWIGNLCWYYERTFTLSEVRDGLYFEFCGLDTFCDIYLNGKRIGSAEDMFLTYRIPAGSAAVVGENILRVVFYSPVHLTAGRPERSGAFTTERLYVRRMQCTFSWDWVERFVTFGIFRDCFLCLPSQAQTESIYIYTKSVDSYSAQIGIRAFYELRCDGAYTSCCINSPQGETVFYKNKRVEENFSVDKIDLPSPQLWYPSGYGEQPLYTCVITLYADREMTVRLHRKEVKFGIRTVKLLELPDKKPGDYYDTCRKLKLAPHLHVHNAAVDYNEDFSGFILLVNGTKIFCKGANWVPCSPFPSEESDEKITALLELVKEGGMNMIRVWGGGLFETDHFYNECDRLGLLVTQDFMMACGSYPEDDDKFLSLVAGETKQAAERLRNHPSLVFWTGDNENGTFADEMQAGYNGRKTSLSVIAPILAVYDPFRDFLPSSPYGGKPYGSVTKGTTHNTNFLCPTLEKIRDSGLKNYRGFFESFLCRFCAEQPTIGVPMYSSLKRFLSDEDIFGGGNGLRFHTKNNPDPFFRETELYDYMNILAEKLFGVFRTPHDRLIKLQYVQYEWVRVMSELFRRHKWFSSGIIYWMLNDCWPAAGWSLIDYYGLPKLGYYAFKRTAKPVICSLEKEDGRYNVYLCNDSTKDERVTVELFLMNIIYGNILFRKELDAVSPANESVPVLTVCENELMPLMNGETLLITQIRGEIFTDRTWLFENRPQDVAFPESNVSVTGSDESSITVTSDRFTLAVVLDGNYIFEDNGFSLLPGEKRRIGFRTVPGNGGGEIELRWLGSRN